MRPRAYGATRRATEGSDPSVAPECRCSGLPLEVRDLGGLVLGPVLGVGQILLGLALVLLLATLALERAVAGDVACGLLGTAGEFVQDAHAGGVPGREGSSPPRERPRGRRRWARTARTSA